MDRTCRTLLIAACALPLGLAGGPSLAVTKTWVAPTGSGDWFSSANWSPSGFPSSADDVVFSTGATDTIEMSLSFPITAEANNVSVTSGDMTFLFSQEGDGDFSGDFNVRGGAGAQMAGPMSFAGDILVGSTFSSGSLRLEKTGPLPLFRVTATTMNVGTLLASSASTLNVASGARLTVDALNVGNTASGGGAMQVDGDVDVNGPAHVRTLGTLTVNSSLGLSAQSLTVDGALNHLSGSILVDGFVTLNTPYFLAGVNNTLTAAALLGDPSNFNWSAGTLVLGDNLTIDTTNTYFGSSLALNNNQELVAPTLSVGVEGEGTLTSLGEVFSDFGRVGGAVSNGGNALVSLTGPAADWENENNLRFGDAERADLVVTGGAQLRVGNTLNTNADLQVAIVAGGVSDITVDGVGSSIVVLGTVYLGGDNVGPQGTGTMTLSAGGELDAQTVHVWDGYELDAADGTVAYTNLLVGGAVDLGDLQITGAGLSMQGGTLRAGRVDFDATGLNGSGTIEAVTTIAGDIIATGDLTIGDASAFDGVSVAGNITVGTHRVQLNKSGFFILQNDSVSVNAGGELVVPNGVLLPSGAALNSGGTLSGRIVSLPGSVIDLPTDLTLGDATSLAGVDLQGEVVVRDNMLTLHDANDAVLGSLTMLGDGLSNPGIISAPMGLTLNFGDNLAGFGTVNTIDDPASPLTNNGNIIGDSLAEPITLTGYVKGAGTFNNVVFAGTFAPGFSPAAVTLGNAAYTGTTQIEIGGNAPGSIGGHDQLNHLIDGGEASLGGHLELSLINGFTPAPYQSFTVLTSTTLNGTAFDTVGGVVIGPGQGLAVTYTATDVIVTAALLGDNDLDGDIDDADLGTSFANYTGPLAPGVGGKTFIDGDTDGDGDVDDADLGSSFAGYTGPLTVNVPEPASVLWLAAAFAGLGRCRRYPR